MAKKISSVWTIVVAVLATVLLGGCTLVVPAPNVVRFSLNNTVDYDTKQQFISIASEQSWVISIEHVEPSEEWCTLSKFSGTGNGSVLMTFGENPLNEDRVAIIHVTFHNETISLTFTQHSSSYIPTPPTFDDLSGWLELPHFQADGERYYFSKHMLPSTENKERSFSLLYDADNFIPLWVAYPLCRGNIGGAGNRVNDWGIMDPNIPTDKQLYMKNSYQGYYDRGHMLPSASRLGSNDDNRQTFYPTNMTPQIAGLNQQKWAGIENQVRDWAYGCDTLYVVTGAVLQTVGGNEPISYTYCKSDSNKDVAIPNYYYKALLQYRDNNGSKSYEAIALWVPHKAANGAATINDAITIDQLEERTGIDFFPHLDDTTEERVESSINPARWQL